MNILIVGNVIKDVYLSLDSRTENLETDRNNVKWLELSFDASKHHFFHRISSFGGSAVSLEVFTKMGILATINNSDYTINDSEKKSFTPPHTYRYILTSEDNVSYLTPTKYTSATFTPPITSPNYIYIDRSANLDAKNAEKVKFYIETHLETSLILYLKDFNNQHLNSLIEDADLIFIEGEPPNQEKSLVTKYIPDSKNIIFVTDHAFYYQDIMEPVTVKRIDKLTHLSAYSIATATIIGGFILGKTVEASLKLARTNLENSTLDSTLSLKELETISSNPVDDLELIAANLMATGKGILAADESGGSIHKKFETLDIPDTYENRHDYRNIFFTTQNIEQYLNGVILFDETARDYMNTGESIPDYLIAHRIIPGIKVDEGLEPFGDKYQDGTQKPYKEETYTKGLDSLDHRLREYYEMGLYFAKWRSAFNVSISDNGGIITPSPSAIQINTKILAEYAKKCQSAGLVPIVEPEVVYDGNYSLAQCAEITSTILDSLFKELKNYDVNLRACILKCNMILAGKQYEKQPTPEEIAKTTAEVLKQHAPAELAGIVFLSGGQTPEQATNNLSAIIKADSYPWPISFSFARALQDPALLAWHGDNDNQAKAKDAFKTRLDANVKALIKS